MKKTILVLLLVCFCTSLFANKENTDAVYLKLVKEYTLHDDGQVTYHQNHQLQLLSYYASSRRYGETFLVYDTTFQKLTVKKNNTTMADGKTVTAPKNAFNLVLPRFARNAADYNHLREMVITHIGLENKAIIDLDYSIDSNADFMTGLMGDELLAEDSPINEFVLRIKIPANKNLHFKMYNSDVQPITKTIESQKIYEWTFQDVPAIIHEPAQMTPGDFHPRLLFSSLDDLESSLTPLFERFMQNNQAPKIELDGNSELERVLNLQKIVVEDMATFPIPMSTVGYRFRSAKKVWDSNGGTHLEKANLMVALLAETGINARLVMVGINRDFDPGIASLLNFSKVGVCVHLKNGQAFMLAVDDLNKLDLRYTYGGRQALVFTKDGIKTPTLPNPKAELNVAEMNMQIAIKSNDSLSGHFNVQLSGAAQPYLELQRKQDQGAYLLNKIMPLSKLTRLNSFSDNEVQLQASFEQSDGLIIQKNYLFYHLPQNPFGIAALHLPTLNKTRYSPVQLSYNNFQETVQYRISVPETLSVVTKKITVQKKNSAGELEIRISDDNGTLLIDRSLKINKHNITLSEYDDLMELWRLWNAPAYQQVVFKRN